MHALAASGTRPVMSCLLAAAIVISPLLYWSLLGGAGYHDKQRLVQLGGSVAAGLLVAWVFWRNLRLPHMVSKPVATLLAVFFALGLLSSTMAYSSRHALLEWSNLLLLLGVAWLVAMEVNRLGETWLDTLLLVNGLGCVLYVLLAITVYGVMLRTGQQPGASLLIPGFDNHRFFSHTQTVSLPLLALLATRTQDRERKVFWWSITVLWWMLLCVAAGRGTVMGLLAGSGVIVCLWRNRSARHWCLSMWATGLSGLTAYLLLYVLLPVANGLKPFGFLVTAVERSVDNPTSGRLQLWARALEMVANHPWLGAGPLHFAHEARDLQLGAHPHSWVLQVASEWGLPATLCLAVAVTIGLGALWRARVFLLADDTRDTCTLAAWLVAGIAIVVDGLVSGLIVMPASQLWIAMYLGCAWGWVSLRRGGQPVTLSDVPARGTRVAVLVLVPLLVCALLLGVWPEMRDIQAHEQQANQDSRGTSSVTLRPRILRAGYF